MKSENIRIFNEKLEFEKSGETISIQIILKNVSPEKNNTVKGFLDNMFTRLKKSL